MFRVFAFGLVTTMTFTTAAYAQEEAVISSPTKAAAPAVVFSALDKASIPSHSNSLMGDSVSDITESDAAGGTTTKHVSCRTSPTNTSGRKSCNDYASNTLPAGYYYDVNSKETRKTSDIGTSNWIRVTFHDYFEIPSVPGAYVPRTMRVRAHARSGHGYGERGYTKGWGRAKYKKLP